jgi:hypothetical protein
MAGVARDEQDERMRHEALTWLASAVRFEQFITSLRAPHPDRARETVQLQLVERHDRRGGEDRAA